MNTITSSKKKNVKFKHSEEVYERLEKIRKHKRKIKFLTIESFISINGCVKCQ